MQNAVPKAILLPAKCEINEENLSNNLLNFELIFLTSFLCVNIYRYTLIFCDAICGELTEIKLTIVQKYVRRIIHPFSHSFKHTFSKA